MRSVERNVVPLVPKSAAVTANDLAIASVHGHCGVFTRPDVACGILDLVGWKADSNLTGQRLLEPSCGDGSFLIPAVERLLQSASRSGTLSEKSLRDMIVAFEFDASTAATARTEVEKLLLAAGFARAVAGKLANRWVRCEDFLLADELGTFTHIVGNPPYMRWSKVPTALRRAYEAKLPKFASKGDLCLAFVWRAAELARPSDGRVAFLCADRWLRCAYGLDARKELTKRFRVATHLEVHAVSVFLGARKVGAYAAITVLDQTLQHGSIVAQVASLQNLLRRLTGAKAHSTKQPSRVLAATGGAIIASTHLASLFERMTAKTVRLKDAGAAVRCGMALGLAAAFVVGEDSDIEADRLVPFLRSRDIGDDGRARPVKRVVNVWSSDGALIDLTRYPATKAHLERHKVELQKRVCVAQPGDWYRTIDRLNLDRVAAQKILIAGMAKTSRLAMSPGGVQPSNSLYAVTSEVWPLEALYALFRAGLLDIFAAVLAPTFAGGSKRFDGNVLGQVRIPLWSNVPAESKRALAKMDTTASTPHPELIADIYGVRSAEHRKTLAAVTAREPLNTVAK